MEKREDSFGYMILEENSREKLEQAVLGAMGRGWTVQGGVSVETRRAGATGTRQGTFYAQAMVM